MSETTASEIAIDTRDEDTRLESLSYRPQLKRVLPGLTRSRYEPRRVRPASAGFMAQVLSRPCPRSS